MTLECLDFTSVADIVLFRLVSSFCKDYDLSEDKSTDLTNNDGGDGNWNGYAGFKFHFEWKKNDGQCSNSCEDVFNKFTGMSSCKSCTRALR